MSLGGGRSQALDDAVQTMIDAGIVTVVAAGNSNRDACGFSPAAVPDAITVGSSTNRDGRSSFSNFGRCVDIFAPGSNIQSAWINGSNASRSISGTSMASPHVAGAAALLLEQFPSASPQKIEELMLRAATTGTISNVGSGSPNLMLFTRFDFEGGEPTPPAPEPDPEDPCGGDCEVLSGSMQQGDQVILVDSFRASGKMLAILKAPAGTQFDLILQKRNWLFGWQTVDSVTSPNAPREIEADGDGSQYRWIAEASKGSGEFSFYYLY